MTRLFARAPRGERVFGYRPHQRGNNITIVSAMGSDGIVASMTLEGYIDGNAFLAYVEQALVPQLSPSEIIVMDNLSRHKVNGVIDAIKSVGADVLYSPPYSPFSHRTLLVKSKK